MPEGSAPRILFVCTANVCRSPMAAAIMAHRLLQRGVAADVASAGTHPFGLEVPAEVLRVVHEAGAVPPYGHEARTISALMLRHEGTDLVITMTSEQRREVVMVEPPAWPRTFTLRELPEAGADRGSPSAAGEPLEAWVERLSAGREVDDLYRDDPADDIADPFGLGGPAYRAAAAEIDDLLAAVIDSAGW